MPQPASIDIEIANEQSLLAVDAARIRETAKRILCDSGVTRGTLSVAIVDDAAIHEVNRRFLDHDYPTDVLSFALDDDDGSFDGEVIVSAEMALSNSADTGWPPEVELLLYVIHGTLHLAGYRDKTDSDRAAMREAERKYLVTLENGTAAGA